MKNRLFLLLVVASLGCMNADIINGDTDAVGVPRDLSLNTIFAGYDASQTTSIRKHILTHLSSDNLRTFTSTSLLYLQNSSLELDATYTFTHGAIKIVGKVEILGSGHKFRFASHSLSIAEGSELVIGDGVEFEFAPTSSLTTAVRFDSDSSKLTLRSSTLTVSNDLGMHLIGGNLCIEGDSIIDNAFTTTTKALFLGTNITGTNATGDGDCNLQIKSGAKLTVKNAGVVFQNNGAGSFDGAEGEGSLVVEDSANFLFDSTAAFNNGGATFGFSSFEGFSLERVSGIGGVPLASFDFTVGVSSVKFSPDGKFLAAAGSANATNDELAVYSFDGSSLVNVADIPVANGVHSVSFSPDGKFLASGDKSLVSVWSFDGTSLAIVGQTGSYIVGEIDFSPRSRHVAAASTGGSAQRTLVFDMVLGIEGIGTRFDYGSAVNSAKFSPRRDNIIAFGAASGGWAEELAIYQLTVGHILTSTLTRLTEADFGGAAVNSIDFSPDGKFIATGADSGGSTQELAIYSFDGNSLTKVTELDYGAAVYSVSFSPDGKFLAVGAETGGSTNELAIFSFDGNSLTNIAEINYGVAVYSVDFSPDGKFLAMGGRSGGSSEEISIYSLSYNQGSNLVQLKNSTIKLGKDMKLQNIQLTPQ